MPHKSKKKNHKSLIINPKSKRLKRGAVFVLAIIAIMVAVSSVGALNGWFGGGGMIPTDTMTRGLVGYWPMDEGMATTTYDASDYANHGILTNGPRWGGSTTTCKVAGCLSFDGTNDYVDIGNQSVYQFQPSNSFTILAWIQKQAHPKSIVAKGTNTGYELEIDSVGQLAFIGDINTNASYNYSGSTVLNNGTWYFVASVYNGSAVELFLNGKTEGSKSLQIGNNSSNLQIGARDNVLNFTGLIDEVRIYNRALSAEEVRYHYNRGGPVAQWKFDEGEGRTAYDSTDNNNDGTLVLAGSATSSAWVAGKYGGALSFDGVDDYVDAGNESSLRITGNITIESWFKTTMTDYGFTVAKWGATSQDFEIGKDDNQKAYAVLRKHSTAVETVLNGTTVINDGAWHHLAVVYDGSNVGLYVDGVVEDNNSYAAGMDNTAENVLIGKRQSSPQFPFSGLIDDVRIYNYARTPDEIRLDYNSGFAAHFGPKSDCKRDPGSCMTQGLVNYWPFDEGMATTVHDVTNNGNHGILNGGVRWGGSTTTCKFASCFSFDGTDDYITSALPAPYNTNNVYTAEGWVKINSLRDAMEIFSLGYVSDADHLAARAGYIRFSNQGGAWTAQNTLLTLGTWYHVAVIHDGANNNVKIYINGVKDTDEPYTDDLLLGPVGTGIYIGQNVFGAGGSFLDGSVDEFRIYNRALSEEEIRYHYNRGGPVAHWKFDEGTASTTYDTTDNNNDGTLSLGGAGNTSVSSAWVAGKYGSALSFDGADDYVSTPITNLSGYGSITYEAWVKDGGGSSCRRIIDKGGGRAGLSIDCYSNLTWEIRNASAVAQRVTASDPSTNIWTQIAGTYDGSTLKLYINGVLIGSVAQSGTIEDAGDNLTVGAIGGGGSGYFNGLLDDVRVYNYARTLEEIRLDYNSGFAARFGPQSDCKRDPGSCMTQGLAGYWSFDEGMATTAYDSSGYGNNGILTSGPRWGGSTTTCKVAGCLSFDGTNDYVNVGNSSTLNIQLGFSIEWWSNKTGAKAGFVDRVISKEDSYEIHLGNSDPDFQTYRFRIFNTLGSAFDVSDTSPASNEWRHHVVTLDNFNIMRKYNNGVLTGGPTPGPTGTLQNNTSNLIIGAQSTTARFFAGLIDEVRIYNRALSAEEVRYHYNRGGPVAHWKFDEGEGRTAYDSTDNNNDGTLVLVGSATSSAWVAGKSGSALSFDGVDDYVSVNDSNSLSLTSGLTLSLWTKFNTVGSFDTLISKGGDDYLLQIANNNTDDLRFYIESTAACDFSSSQNKITTGKWQHIVATWDGATQKIYIDGSFIQSASCSGTITDDNQVLYIGNEVGQSRYIDGLLDDVRIYNYARSPEQILQDYNFGKAIRFR